jgi:hypothetical protein
MFGSIRGEEKIYSSEFLRSQYNKAVPNLKQAKSNLFCGFQTGARIISPFRANGISGQLAAGRR